MKKTVKTNTVTDEQGRVRFHGAFTGGFSAGYFNTVGSSEGFTPAQFVSSRSNRANRNAQSVTDYMDEGDGLLGGKLSAVAGIDSFSEPSGTNRRVDGGQLGDVLAGVVVQQQSDTIGKKLLGTMGWRAGQGIGPRVSKKRVNYFESNRSFRVDIELHPGVDVSKLPQALKRGGVTFAPDDEAQKIHFPPVKNDLFGIGFDPRSSGSLRTAAAVGEGYFDEDDDGEGGGGSSSQYRISSVLNNIAGGGVGAKAGAGKRAAPAYGQSKPEAKRLKYTSGFAYDDAEDDVYSNSSTALTLTGASAHGGSKGAGRGGLQGADGDGTVVPYGYSREVQEVESDARGEKQRADFAARSRETLHSIEQGVDSWLGVDAGALGGPQGLAQTVKSVTRCPSDNRPPLPGFHVARTLRVLPPHYPPPAVPEGFVPHHSFDAVENTSSAVATGPQSSYNRRTTTPIDAARARSAAMSEAQPLSAAVVNEGNPPKPASIFDLMKPEARAKLQSVLDTVNPQNGLRISEKEAAKPFVPPPPPIPPPPPLPVPSTAPVSGENPPAAPARPMLTSSALLNSTFAGLSQAFKNRFAAASTVEGAGTKDSIVLEGMATATEYSEKLQQKEKLTAAAIAATASATASGARAVPVKGSVRTVTLWAPSSLLCKRMNVKLPDVSKASSQLSADLASTRAAAADPMAQLLGTPLTAPVAAFGRPGALTDTSAVVVDEEEAAGQDVYQAETAARPALSVFKSIFEDSDSDSDNDSESNGEGEGDKGADREDADTQRCTMESSGDALKTSAPVGRVSGPALVDPAMGPNRPGGALPAREMSAPPAAGLQADNAGADGPVRFVPSKLRAATGSIGATKRTLPGGIASASSATREKYADSDDDVEDAPHVVGRQKTSTAQVEGEGPSDEEGPAVVRPAGVSRRPQPQAYAGIGPGGGGGRFRSGRDKAASALRQRLLAQQQDEGEEGGEAAASKPERETVSTSTRSLPRPAADDRSRVASPPVVFEERDGANPPIPAEIDSSRSAMISAPVFDTQGSAELSAPGRPARSRWGATSSGEEQAEWEANTVQRESAYLPLAQDSATMAGPPPPPPLPPLPPPPPPPPPLPTFPDARVESRYASAAGPAQAPYAYEGPALGSAIYKLQSSLMADKSDQREGREKKSSKAARHHKSHRDSKHKHKKDKRSSGRKKDKKERKAKKSKKRASDSDSHSSDSDEGYSSSSSGSA